MFRLRLMQRMIGIHGSAYWPVHPSSQLSFPRRVLLGRNTYPGLAPNCYVDGHMGLVIGDGVLVGSGVGLISSNHKATCLIEYVESPPIVIGDHCVIEDGCVILPGVELAEQVHVISGSVVTKSCLTPRTILAGNPAVEIGRHVTGVVAMPASAKYGYIPARKFESFRKANLSEEFFGRFALRT